MEPGISGRFRLKLRFCFRFGLFASPTSTMLEQTATDICPFADMDAISLCTHGPVLKHGARHAKARINAKIREEQERRFRLHASLVSAGVARKVVAFPQIGTFFVQGMPLNTHRTFNTSV